MVSGAGRRRLAELAALKKAAVLVPFERLPGAHQLKNAEKSARSGAAFDGGDEKILQ